MKRLSDELILKFQTYLINEEKSIATIEKYIRDVSTFAKWCGSRMVDKELVLGYKQMLVKKYALSSVNSILSSLNSFFEHNCWSECHVKTIKIQRQIFSSSDKELTKADYKKLLDAAKRKNNTRLFYLMQTICATGIRVSELKFITVEAVGCGVADINCKGKQRKVWLPKSLCKMLKKYAGENSIKCGSVFISKNGRPLDRSNIWKMLKALCETAGVSKNKVFPHNFRHLFARTYYSLQKDIVRLADILGHSNINTTRIYTIESGDIHRRQVQKLGLLQC